MIISSPRNAASAVFAALLIALLTLPARSSAMGSLPTGPSESSNESEISQSGLTDMFTARVRLLADREFQAILVQEIEVARSEIVLSHHLFTASEERADRPREVADALAAAVTRGLDVIVVLEIGREASLITQANRESARFLKRRGIRIYGDMSGTVAHARLAVIDRQLVFMGSHDLTQQSMGRYREVSLVVDSSPLATSVLGFIESLDPVPYREAPRAR